MPASVIRPGRVSADRELRQLGTIVPANAPAANCGSQQWQAILAQSRPQLERLTAIQDRQSRIVDACDVFLRMDARFGSLSAVIALEWLMLRA
jgi:hypothetical protein